MGADDVHAIEAAFVQHWRHFGTGPGAQWHEDEHLTWLEAPAPQLPYNGVVRTALPDGPEADRRIEELARRFEERGVPFMWVVHPTATPASLPQRLEKAGVPWVEPAFGMALDLHDAPPPAPVDGVELVEVHDEQRMDAFEALSADYWHLLPETVPFVHAENSAVGYGPDASGIRFLAYVDGEPAGKGYLSYLGVPGTAAVFAVSVLERFRGKRVASAVMNALLANAVATGHERVVLHSTEMAHSLYGRLGFRDVATFELHATAAVH
jgi:GNAT superfamily N-acetyltransferase